MAKKGSQKKDSSSRSGKRKTRGEYVDPQNMDDDIDSFHKQRDIIPLDVDADVGELSDDEEEAIFDNEAINNDEEEDEDDDMDEDAESSENDLYEQVKQKRAAKLAAKAEIYTRTSAPPSLPETADGKRHITYQIEKNRGLTRPRNKLTKTPRKKYRTKHDKAQKRRLGQVRQIKKPSGPYGGESSGINARISRSIRL